MKTVFLLAILSCVAFFVQAGGKKRPRQHGSVRLANVKADAEHRKADTRRFANRKKSAIVRLLNEKGKALRLLKNGHLSKDVANRVKMMLNKAERKPGYVLGMASGKFKGMNTQDKPWATGNNAHQGVSGTSKKDGEETFKDMLRGMQGKQSSNTHNSGYRMNFMNGEINMNRPNGMNIQEMIKKMKTIPGKNGMDGNTTMGGRPSAQMRQEFMKMFTNMTGIKKGQNGMMTGMGSKHGGSDAGGMLNGNPFGEQMTKMTPEERAKYFSGMMTGMGSKHGASDAGGMLNGNPFGEQMTKMNPEDSINHMNSMMSGIVSSHGDSDMGNMGGLKDFEQQMNNMGLGDKYMFSSHGSTGTGGSFDSMGHKPTNYATGTSSQHIDLDKMMSNLPGGGNLAFGSSGGNNPSKYSNSMSLGALGGMFRKR